MDRYDRKIIGFLQENADRPLAELADAIGLSLSATNERVRKLKAAGVIRAIEARLDPHAVGLDILAFLQILMDRPGSEGEFLRRVRQLPEVQECHHVTGDWSYLLKVRVRDTAHLERLLSKELKAIAGVARTQTLIALSSPKESAQLDSRGAGDD